MKQFYFLSIIIPILAFSGGYESENENPVEYLVKDLNKIQYESEFLKLNNSVQGIDTDNKVLEKEVDLLKDYFKTTLKNQEYTYKVQIENLVTQHKHELYEQEKRYEALLEHLLYIFGLIGILFSSLILALSWIGYSRIKKTVREKLDTLISKQYDSTVGKLFSDFLGNEQNIVELKAAFDTIEMKKKEKKESKPKQDEDEFDVD